MLAEPVTAERMLAELILLCGLLLLESTGAAAGSRRAPRSVGLLDHVGRLAHVRLLNEPPNRAAAT